MNDFDDDKTTETCISDDLFCSYLEGEISKDELEFVQNHLNSCPLCFEVMTSFIRSAGAVLTENEKQEIEKKIKLTPSEQVSLILSYHEALNKNSALTRKANGGLAGTFIRLKENIKRLLKKIMNEEPFLRPAYALIVVMIFVLGFKYYNTTFQIKRAEQLLQENYKNDIDEVRLSGGYKAKLGGKLMAPEPAGADYVSRAESKLKKAIRKGSKSPKASHLLAQIFLMEQQYARADSVLAQLSSESQTSAALLNDIGVLHFYKQDWNKAAERFQAAIKADNNFLEARYNLALTKIELGLLDEAKAILKTYQQLDDSEAWKDAAQRWIDQINGRVKDIRRL